MVARLGVGATGAAAIIFSVLLISSLLVFAASQERERLYQAADSEDALADYTSALMGAGGVDLLIEAEGPLASNVLPCPGAQGVAAGMVSTLSVLQQAGNVSVRVTAAAAPGSTQGDNLTMLAPFDGSVAGDLDLSLTMAASGGSTAAGAWIGKTEVHLAHLPVRLAGLSSDCQAAFEAVSQAISSTPLENCTSALEAPAIDRASRPWVAAAADDGFRSRVSFTVVPGSPCGVDLLVQVWQVGVRGPAGYFTVQVAESGAVSFARPAS